MRGWDALLALCVPTLLAKVGYREAMPQGRLRMGNVSGKSKSKIPQVWTSMQHTSE